MAFILAGGLVIVSLIMAYCIHTLFFAACIFYLAQNILYTLWLKNFALIDVTIISFGFLIRLFAGGVIADIPISNWMYIMAFLLAMLLALGKRRDDLLILENEGQMVRQAIRGYNIDFINCISYSCVSMISFANFFNLGLLVLLYILCDVVNAVE